VRNGWRRAAALVAVLGPVALIGPRAGAHAFLQAQFPEDGQILDVATVPTVVRYDFNEDVVVDPAGFAIRDAEGAIVSGPASATGLPDAPRLEATPSDAGAAASPTTISVASSSPLAEGGYALETSTRSADGHQLVQAYGFRVGAAPQATNLPIQVDLPATNAGTSLTASVDGTSPGTRTVRVAVPDGVTGGEVRLTCRRAVGERTAKVRAPFIWRLRAPRDDGTAIATGYLPVPCAYTLRLTLNREFPASPTSYVTGPGRGLTIAP
jgi:methionine-rich copper-binding protein CopC